MKILNPDGSPVENPTIEQQIAALMAGHDTLSNAAAKSADDVAALNSYVTDHGTRLTRLEKFITSNPLPRKLNTVNGREV